MSNLKKILYLIFVFLISFNAHGENDQFIAEFMKIPPMNTVILAASWHHCGPYNGCSLGGRKAQALHTLGFIQNSGLYKIVGYPGAPSDVLYDRLQEIFENKIQSGNDEHVHHFIIPGMNANEAALGPPYIEEESTSVKWAKKYVDLIRHYEPDAQIWMLGRIDFRPAPDWLEHEWGLTQLEYNAANVMMLNAVRNMGVRTIDYNNLLWAPTHLPRQELGGLPDYHIDPLTSYLNSLEVHLTLLRDYLCRRSNYLERSEDYCKIVRKLPQFRLDLDVLYE